MDAVRESRVKVEDLKAEQLPEEMKKMAPAERKEVFLSQLRDGVIAGPDIQPRADAVPLDDAEKAWVRARLVDVEVKAIMRGFRANGKEKTAELFCGIVNRWKEMGGWRDFND